MSSSTHKAVLRRSVHAVAAIALGTGLLAGLTAAAVVTTTPTPASAAASQTQNCAISSGGAYEYNQLQNGTTLAPFMLFNGTAISPTAGDTISVACTGLSGPASDS